MSKPRRKPAAPSLSKTIHVRGAREHNLKNVDLEIPRDSLVVFTGLSGSGKSSLAFDTIYAEGHRRYVESLSAYARQFLEMMKSALDCVTFRPSLVWRFRSSLHLRQGREGTSEPKPH